MGDHALLIYPPHGQTATKRTIYRHQWRRPRGRRPCKMWIWQMDVVSGLSVDAVWNSANDRCRWTTQRPSPVMRANWTEMIFSKGVTNVCFHPQHLRLPKFDLNSIRSERRAYTQLIAQMLAFVYYAPAQGALSDDAVWRLSVWRLWRTSGWRAACAAGRLDGAYCQVSGNYFWKLLSVHSCYPSE